jgi:hypothetical protein
MKLNVGHLFYDGKNSSGWTEVPSFGYRSLMAVLFSEACGSIPFLAEDIPTYALRKGRGVIALTQVHRHKSSIYW